MTDALVAVPGGLDGPDAVDRPPVGDRHDPRHRAALVRVEALGVAPDLGQDLLGDLLGPCRVADDAAADADDLGRDAVEEGGVGRRVTLRARHQQLIGRPVVADVGNRT